MQCSLVGRLVEIVQPIPAGLPCSPRASKPSGGLSKVDELKNQHRRFAMKYRTPCPTCGAPVSVWRIMSAPTPFGYKCSKCGKKFCARGWAWITVVVALLAIGCLGWSLNYLMDTNRLSASNAFIIFLIVFVVGEITYSFLVINKSTLVAIK
jgi:hypothetical protein